MNLKRQILTFVTILAFVSSNAKIATWSISPIYQNLQRYSGELYLFQNNGKWGIIKAGDQIILQADYDFITPFVNGYALAGSKEGTKYLLQSIISEDGNISSINEKFYLPGSNQYFSEDKLVISNKNGKYGYIDPVGNIVVKCQFDNALPFKEGYAPVKQGNYMKFISENYDRNASRNTLAVDFHYGEMTAAGCFSNGLAPVAYNTDYALVNTKGQKVRKIKEADFKQTFKANNAAPVNNPSTQTKSSIYSEYSENGKYGLRQGDNIIVTPQFDSFGDKYSDGNIIAILGGKHGVLCVNDGEVSINVKVNGIHSSELEVDRKGNIQPITIECNIPAKLANYRILLNDGNGTLIDKTSEFARNDNLFTFTAIPSVSKNADECETRVVIEQGGIVLADNTQQFSIVYPIKLRVSAPGPTTVRANENDLATVSSTIFNDSNKSVTVTASWSNGKSSSVSIPAHGSRTVSTTFTITSYTTKDVSIKLSSGERAQSKITFNTFF